VEKPSFAAWRNNFIHDITLHMHRFPRKLVDPLKAWVASLP
jgi:hypothetical protein